MSYKHRPIAPIAMTVSIRAEIEKKKKKQFYPKFSILYYAI